MHVRLKISHVIFNDRLKFNIMSDDVLAATASLISLSHADRLQGADLSIKTDPHNSKQAINHPQIQDRSCTNQFFSSTTYLLSHNNPHNRSYSTTMAPTHQTKMSSSTTTPSKPKSSIHVADPNSAPALYADQSGSRLMSLPKELRNKIYTLVFCDNIDRVREPIRYDWKVEAVVADAPARVNLDSSSPPSKGAILACRELYEEMKGMYVAAYRIYWSDNRFVYDAGLLGTASVLPANKDLQHVQQFCLVLHRLSDYYVHIVFEGGKWDSWLLPAGDRILGFKDFGVWFLNQGALKDAVTEYMASLATTWSSLDPRAGRGLTREMLEGVASDEEVIDAVQCQQDFEETVSPGTPDSDK